MKSLLTPYLLNFLTGQGYRYLLSKTEVIEKEYATIRIALTPTSKKPSIRRLPLGFDTFFNIDEEPRQMALGIDDTEVVVYLSDKDGLSLKIQLIKFYDFIYR